MTSTIHKGHEILITTVYFSPLSQLSPNSCSVLLKGAHMQHSRYKRFFYSWIFNCRLGYNTGQRPRNKQESTINRNSVQNGFSKVVSDIWMRFDPNVGVYITIFRVMSVFRRPQILKTTCPGEILLKETLIHARIRGSRAKRNIEKWHILPLPETERP